MTDSSLPQPHPDHVVQFYGDDSAALSSNVGRYLSQGLAASEAVVAFCTPEHEALLCATLTNEGTDLSQARETGRIRFHDAESTLNWFMAEEDPDWMRFEATVGRVLREASACAPSGRGRAYGEMVGVLWNAERYSAAVQLEVFWNRLLKASGFQLFCGYPIDILDSRLDVSSIHALVSAHAHVYPASSRLQAALDRALDEVLGTRAGHLRSLLETMVGWDKLPHAEATILWLRNMLPDHSDAILARTRQHYLEALGAGRTPDDSGLM